LGIGLGIPILFVALYWFYEGQRYDIIEGLGCYADVPNTILHYFLQSIWPVVIGLVSSVYCVLTLRTFYRRRQQFKELIASGHQLTFSRYFRLMALSSTDILFTVPLGLLDIITDAQQPIYPWRGLSDIHFDFDNIPQVPAVEWLPSLISRESVYVSIWAPIVTAFMFFMFFGFAEEARKHYHLAAVTVARWCGLNVTKLNQGSAGSQGPSWLRSVGLPSFVRPQTPAPSSTACTSAGRPSDFDDSFSDMKLDDLSSDGEHKAPYVLDAKIDSSLHEKPLPDLPTEPGTPIDLTRVFRATPDVPSPVGYRDSYDMV